MVKGSFFLSSYARANSLNAVGTEVSIPTTSNIPASRGSAMLNPFDVIPTTINLAAIPVF